MHAERVWGFVDWLTKLDDGEFTIEKVDDEDFSTLIMILETINDSNDFMTLDDADFYFRSWMIWL